jgi:hypothetical protein
MIANHKELETTQERIRHFQAQLAHLRKLETNPVNYRLSGIRLLGRSGSHATGSARIPCFTARGVGQDRLIMYSSSP